MLPVGHDGSADSSIAYEQSMRMLRAVEEIEYEGRATSLVTELAVELLDCTRGSLTRRWSLANSLMIKELSRCR